jgi:uncharacterized protein YbaP (TraB family)
VYLKLVILVLGFSLGACTTTPLSVDKISLWKLKQGAATVYLLGSVHALTADEYPLPESMERAFDAADQTVFEVDLVSSSDQKIARLIQELGFYSPPLSLQTELSDDTLVLLEKHLASKGQSLASVKRMKPWFLSLTLALQELEALEFDANLGIDQYFQGKARLKNKPVLQLESIEEQFELLASDPDDIQELSLRSGIEESDQVEVHINELISAWRVGDAEAMWRTGTNTDHYPQLEVQMKKLIDDRNLKMAEKISVYLDSDKTTLVVVGALHMGGSHGILKLLSSRYDIEQLGPQWQTP